MISKDMGQDAFQIFGSIRRQKLKKLQGRNQKGLQSFELAIGSFAIILMTMLSLDLIIPMLGDSVLDRATRDACRAAAAQANLTTAVSAANAALASHQTDGYWITQPTLTSTASPAFAYVDYGGDPTKGNPYVQVTCTLNVRLPINLEMFGQNFFTYAKNATGGSTGMIPFTRSYQFPIIKFQLGTNFS